MFLINPSPPSMLSPTLPTKGGLGSTCGVAVAGNFTSAAGYYAPPEASPYRNQHNALLVSAANALATAPHAMALRRPDGWSEMLIRVLPLGTNWVSYCDACAPNGLSIVPAVVNPTAGQEVGFINTRADLGTDLPSPTSWVFPTFGAGAPTTGHECRFDSMDDAYVNAHQVYFTATIAVGSASREELGLSFSISSPTSRLMYRPYEEYYTLRFGFRKNDVCPTTSEDAGTIRLYRFRSYGSFASSTMTLLYRENYVPASSRNMTVMVVVDERPASNIISVLVREDYAGAIETPRRNAYRFSYEDTAPLAMLPRGGKIGLITGLVPDTFFTRLRFGFRAQPPNSPNTTFGYFVVPKPAPGAPVPLIRTFVGVSNSLLGAPSINQDTQYRLSITGKPNGAILTGYTNPGSASSTLDSTAANENPTLSLPLKPGAILAVAFSMSLLPLS